MINCIEINNILEYKDQVKIFFAEVPFGRYLSDKKIEISKSVEIEFQNISKYSNKGLVFFALNEQNKIEGIIGFHFSEWDTNVFKKRVSILQYFLVIESNSVKEEKISNRLLEIYHKWAETNYIDVAITKLDTKYFSPVLSLQNNGYIFYECITYRSVDINRDYRFDQDIKYRYALEKDKVQLKALALKNTFKKSHFYLDPNFDLENVEEMYSRWIENALNSNQKIVIIEQSMKIAGVFIYELVDLSELIGKKYGVWKFAAVDSNFREKGIGMNLFRATLQSCIDEGAEIVDTSIAEKNIISQNFHDKLGFRLINTLYTFHKWFK